MSATHFQVSAWGSITDSDVYPTQKTKGLTEVSPFALNLGIGGRMALAIDRQHPVAVPSGELRSIEIARID
jgi:hypothetical protein